MSRRRYLSTTISTDKRVADLAQQAGPWAALIYTWCIPHAGDDACISADPEELLSQVAPTLAMRGLVSIEDVERFLEVATDLGLLERTGECLHFPKPAYYRHQSYIGAQRRNEPTPPEETRETAQIPAESRKTPQNGAVPRTAAQNRASFKSSSSLRSSFKSSLRDDSVANATGSAKARAPSKSAGVIDAFRALGLEPILTARDHAAIKASNADPKLIAEVYHAVATRQYPKARDRQDFMLPQLSVHAAIEWINGYQQWRNGTLRQDARVAEPGMELPVENPDHWTECPFCRRRITKAYLKQFRSCGQRACDERLPADQRIRSRIVSA